MVGIFSCLLLQELTLLGAGERAPVGVRLADPPASVPSHWMLCTAARQFRAALNFNISALDSDPMPLKRLVERKDGTSAEGEW